MNNLRKGREARCEPVSATLANSAKVDSIDSHSTQSADVCLHSKMTAKVNFVLASGISLKNPSVFSNFAKNR